MDTDTLRQKYLNFFARKGHRIAASSSLVPADDPTLLFTSAGMNQFKKELLGDVAEFRRAASCQRCLRTDDLDKVGLSAYHHTFFEMLGNFSFGSYFKEEAIGWAWEFLVEELKLNAKVLWVSVYREDDEAYNIWKKKVGFPEEKIVKLGPQENFWPANAIKDGPNGPCGPCSELFFDYGKDAGCKRRDCSPGCNCGRFVEIWNLVFTQFNRKDKGILEPLPNKNIDTGMGLERMAAVLQGVKSNFEIDIFRPIIAAIRSCQLSTVPAERDPALNLIAERDNCQLINAIADHIRAIIFAIYDGVIPSNEQRGYVVRKLIRKAGFHGYTLGIKGLFLHKLVPIVAGTFDSVYPDLKNRAADIADIIRLEENNFGSTLKDAPRLLSNEFKQTESQNTGTGHSAFKLHDTYGIPLEITRAWAKGQGFEINEEEFNQDFRLQQERSKKASKISEGIFVEEAIDLGASRSKFLGYRMTSVKGAKVLKIIKGSQLVKAAGAGEVCQIILDRTPFYAESGGQIGDRGKILKGKNIFKVEDTQKRTNAYLHFGLVENGKFKLGDLVSAAVDPEIRQAVARAHTATHLLQSALREVLGGHIKQAGSSVEADRLRFDFIHSEKLSGEDLKRIENLVQKNILRNYAVTIKETTLKEAKKAKAIALFEDKYASRVRLVNIGNYSKELCAGTHLKSSCEAGSFRIISEGSISRGVRRIEALTGELARENFNAAVSQINKISGLLEASDGKILSILEDKLKKLGRLEKEFYRLSLELFKYGAIALIEGSEKINETKIICNKYEETEMGALRQIVDLIKSRISSYAICLGASCNSKAHLVIAFSDDVVKKGAYASGVIKEVASLLDGDGGGRENMAQAGGSNIQGIGKALDRFKEIIQDYLIKFA